MTAIYIQPFGFVSTDEISEGEFKKMLRERHHVPAEIFDWHEEHGLDVRLVVKVLDIAVVYDPAARGAPGATAYTYQGMGGYEFVDRKQAMLFKLTWGGA